MSLRDTSHPSRSHRPPPPGPARRALPALLPLGLGLALAVGGHPLRSALLLGAGAVVLLLAVLGFDLGRRVTATAQVLGRLAFEVLSVGLYVVVFLPAWAWSRIRRRDLLRSGGPSRGWAPVPAPVVAGAPAGGVTAPHAGRLVGRLSWAIGAVVLVAAANYGIGWTWDRATRSDPPTAAPRTSSEGPATPSTLPASGQQFARDPRNDLPAMAAYPWREQYFDELQRTTGTYWPFTEYRPTSFTSSYVNLRSWVRRSFVAPGDTSTRPVVWMFGGSAAFGEGQRDDHTIASEVARLAAAAGTPIRIDNYGQRGWTHFQERILYEQELSLRPDPDFALFFDGRNEVTAQTLLDEAVPSHVLAYTYAERLGLANVATEFVAPEAPAEPDLLGDLWTAYEEHSALKKVADAFRGSPAGAAPAEDPPAEDPPAPGFTGGQQVEADGTISLYHPTPQDGRDAARVYREASRLTLALSRQHQVKTTLFWQPLRFSTEADRLARAALGPEVVDLGDSLAGHDDVYIDTSHTNEEGARIVAEAIWARLRPQVRAWYRTH